MEGSHSYFSKFSKFYEKADMFGYRIQLSLQKKKFVTSKFGASLSLLILATCAYFFYLFIIQWSNNSKLQTIPSFRSTSVPQIMSQNLSSFYDLDYNNYNIYFALVSTFEKNKTTLNYKQLKRYLTQKVFIGQQAFDLEPCNQGKLDTFLLFSGSQIKIDENKTSNYSLCLKNGFKLGYIMNASLGGVFNPTLTYQVSKCENSTDNNYSCASDSEIMEILTTAHVQISVPRSIYDFTDPIMPRKRIYDNQIYVFDNTVSKLYLGYLIPTQVQTDVGFFFKEVNQIDSTDFNIDGNMQYQTTIGGKNLPLLQYDLQIGYNTQTYYRTNVKFLEMLANLGGTLNILMVLGRIICLTYNAHVSRFKLINYSFENLDNDNKILRRKNDGRVPPHSFKFSMKNICCPSFLKNKAYAKAMKSISEYMDIDKIIKRLQDVDKLKMLLLDDNQIKVFEILPKPGISARKSIKNLTGLTFESVSSSPQLPPRPNEKKIHEFAFLMNGDKINKKMLQLLGPSFDAELHAGHEDEIKEKCDTESNQLCESQIQREIHILKDSQPIKHTPFSNGLHI